MNSTIVKSPAKINLFLEIAGKREDGYHEIITWLHAIDVEDEVSVASSDREYCTLRTPDTTIPIGKRNLCIKAFETMREQLGIERTIEITLTKSIPLGSGLGGGSSNAASVINAVNSILKLNLTLEQLHDIAARVGMDVPFFIEATSAIATGRGEVITPLPSFPKPVWLVVIQPDFSISTGEAYKWLGSYRGDRRPDHDKLSAMINSNDIDALCATLYNAFEGPVFKKYPEMKKFKDKLVSAGCLAASLTGSGSALFGVCADEYSAHEAAENMRGWKKTNFLRVCHTT